MKDLRFVMNYFHSTIHFSLFIIRYSFLLLISVCSLEVSSQQPADYQLFRQDATFFYHEISWSSLVVGVKLDSSAQTAEGTEWYNHHSIYQKWISPEMYPCYRPDGPSWIGWKLLVKPNGDNVLFGRHDYDVEIPIEDTLLIRTKAMPGDSWCYLHSSADVGPDTVATVTRCGIMTFLGITDSIKVIDLGVDSIILSKEHGLVRALNFRDFCPGYNYEKYELSGITSADTIIGVHLLTRRDIYDFEVGDIFHKSRHVSGWPYATMYDVYEVLEKTFSEDQDTVFYQLSDINWWVGPEGTSVPEYDTVNEVYNGLSSYVMRDHLPNETIWDPDWVAYYEMWMYYTDGYNGRPVIDDPYEIYMVPEPPDSCYPSMATYSSYSYIEGCGDLMHLYDDYHECVPCEYLDYFEKGEEEWGTPFTIPTGIYEHQQLPVKIYPVPSADYVMVDIDKAYYKDDLTITLTDISGRIIIKNEISTDRIPYRMDLQVVEKGMYLLKISAGEKTALKKIIH